MICFYCTVKEIFCCFYVFCSVFSVDQMVYCTMGVEAGLKGFSAAVLGGIGVLYGSVVGGVIVGVAEALAVAFLGGSFRSATAYIVLFLVLLIRPSGLFGKDNIDKV